MISPSIGYRRGIGEFKRPGVKGADPVGVAVSRANPVSDKIIYEDRIESRIEPE